MIRFLRPFLSVNCFDNGHSLEITTKYFVVWRKKYRVMIVKGNCYPWFSHNFCLLNRIGGNLCHWDDVVPLLLCYWPINRISSQYCLISKKRYKRNKIGRDTWLLCIESFFPNQIHFLRGIFWDDASIAIFDHVK